VFTLFAAKTLKKLPFKHLKVGKTSRVTHGGGTTAFCTFVIGFRGKF
jgi:hypothetical protein